MRLTTRDPDPRVRRIALFRRVIPFTAGLVGLVLLALTRFDPAGQSPWTNLVQPIVTICVAVIPLSLLFSVLLTVLRDREDKKRQARTP